MTAQATPTERKMPAPLVSPEVQAWFDATAQGRLMYRHCSACARPHHAPRSICPHCYSGETTWRTSGGVGTVYTYSVLRRGTPVPYCIAYVSLDEGVTMLTNLVDCDFDAVHVGMRVKLRFVQAEGGFQMPVFSPWDAEAR